MAAAERSPSTEVAVLCGPTAAGKSGVAMWIAAQRDVTIVSADSRQVYRGFDVGTAKPTLEERARVPHRGVDVADPIDRYSAAAWAAQADLWIAEAIAQRRTPIVVGGTGLYLRALFDAWFAEPPLDPDRRRALAGELARYDTAELRRLVASLDPPRAHLGRTQLLRSAEIALLAGERLSDLQRDRATPPRWRARYLVVDPGPPLADTIARRIDEMLDHGWPDEVERLMREVPPEAPAWNATGYGVVRRMVCGEVDRPTARQSILVSTRQYAKRQRTWFRHQLPADRVAHLDPRAADWQTTSMRWLGGEPAAGGSAA